MPAPSVIHELVERFERNLSTYKSRDYNEANVQQEFINVFFAALGWDMENRRGATHDFKDVIVQYTIKDEESNRIPDYTFRLDGRDRFYVEAKRPSIDVSNNVSPAYQLRRYGWTKKLPIGVVTDFEELAVYDTFSFKPKLTDSAKVARSRYYRFTEYVEKWDEIAALLSRDAVLQGALEQFSAKGRKGRGSDQIDRAFLAEIESWRELLAKNIALRNGDLTQEQLNQVVQKTIDRILFLRICEARDIEPDRSLLDAVNAPDSYASLVQLFKKADSKYNSGLFHFEAEKGSGEEPDTITPSLIIDDLPLRKIIRGMYYPESPYEYSVMPADILGQVYEQFLGKVIRLTKGHHAKVETKPEIRKAGGVFYTPTRIVEQIVRETLGKKLSGVTPNDHRASRPKKNQSQLTILDPACGSGSFLIVAYQFLIDWYLGWYVNDGAENHQGAVFKTSSGEWRLTVKERKRILLDHIYGVDIDAQAVEVTKLSLLLKVLEGETDVLKGHQWRLIQERALPDLSANIKCGNSLVAADIYGQKLLIENDDILRINPFTWKSEYERVFHSGGFDVIVGNPPWLVAGYYGGQELTYLRQAYQTARGKFDLYYLFLELALRLLKNDGLCGMIVPNKFFHTKAAGDLRSLLIERRAIDSIVDFKDSQLFTGATNYSCIVTLRNGCVSPIDYSVCNSDLLRIQSAKVERSSLSREPWHFSSDALDRVFKKVDSLGVPLERFVERFGTGVQSGADRILCLTSDEASEFKLESALLHPILRGRDVRRYVVNKQCKLLLLPYKAEPSAFEILSEVELERYPNAAHYLRTNRRSLEERRWFKKSAEHLSGKWYGLMYVEQKSSFNKPHLLTPSLSDKSNFAVGDGSLFATGTAGVTSVVFVEGIDESLFYFLGLLNSKLLSVYATSHSPVFSGGYFKFSSPYLRKLPIRKIDFSATKEKRLHDKIASSAADLTALNSIKTDSSSKMQALHKVRQIEALSDQIDSAVAELFRLTAEEEKVIASVYRK